MEEKIEEQQEKHSIPWEDYKKLEKLYYQAVKASLDNVLKPKMEVKQQFQNIAELIESGALTEDEALNACKRAINNYAAMKLIEG
jgi:hypothetical protein